DTAVSWTVLVGSSLLMDSSVFTVSSAARGERSYVAGACGLGGDVARHPVPALLAHGGVRCVGLGSDRASQRRRGEGDQLGLLLVTDGDGDRAAGMEATARGGRAHVWRRAGDALDALLGTVQLGERAHEPAGVGVLRVGEELLGGRDLTEPPRVQDPHRAAELEQRAAIAGDEQE